MSSRLDSLLSAEKQAETAVEEAERRARGVRTGIPEEVSAIEKEYSEELDMYEEKSLKTLQADLDTLEKQLEEALVKKRTELESKASVLAPKALELMRAAVEGESG